MPMFFYDHEIPRNISSVLPWATLRDLVSSIMLAEFYPGIARYIGSTIRLSWGKYICFADLQSYSVLLRMNWDWIGFVFFVDNLYLKYSLQSTTCWGLFSDIYRI